MIKEVKIQAPCQLLELLRLHPLVVPERDVRRNVTKVKQHEVGEKKEHLSMKHTPRNVTSSIGDENDLRTSHCDLLIDLHPEI